MSLEMERWLNNHPAQILQSFNLMPAPCLYLSDSPGLALLLVLMFLPHWPLDMGFFFLECSFFPIFTSNLFNFCQSPSLNSTPKSISCCLSYYRLSFVSLFLLSSRCHSVIVICVFEKCLSSPSGC